MTIGFELDVLMDACDFSIEDRFQELVGELRAQTYQSLSNVVSEATRLVWSDILSDSVSAWTVLCSAMASIGRHDQGATPGAVCRDLSKTDSAALESALLTPLDFLSEIPSGDRARVLVDTARAVSCLPDGVRYDIMNLMIDSVALVPFWMCPGCLICYAPLSHAAR